MAWTVAATQVWGQSVEARCARQELPDYLERSAAECS